MTAMDEGFGLASYCPLCQSENYPIGWIGTSIHYSCRDCGWWWSEEMENEDE